MPDACDGEPIASAELVPVDGGAVELHVRCDALTADCGGPCRLRFELTADAVELLRSLI